jgi:two-component system response regulator YesN
MVYKVFLVEDEIVTREGIRDSIDWAGAGLHFCGEAPDGELALPLIEGALPDILIADIKMPFMDGLELSRIVRSRWPQTKILILSGHDEFRYAQEAIQLGVTEYLLKPASAEDLLDVLRKVRDQLDQERQTQEQLQGLQAQVRDNADLVRQHFLLDLVTGRYAAAAAFDAASRLDIDLAARVYLALVVRFVTTGEMSGLTRFATLYGARQRVDAVLQARQELLSFPKDVEEIGFLLKAETAAAVLDEAEALRSLLQETIAGAEKVRLIVGAGRPVARVGELPQSFLEASEMARARAQQMAAQAQHKTAADGARLPDPRSLPQLESGATATFLRRGDAAALDAFLDHYLSPLQEDDAEFMALANYVVTDVLIGVANFAQELDAAPAALLPDPDAATADLAAAHTKAALRAALHDILARALAYRDRHADRIQRLIEQARAYVAAHYTDDDMSLSAVAAAVGLSPSYFSVVFSRATGETFIEYLTRVRVHKAMELLRMTPLSAAEVAYRVGYNNPRYFFAVFKKVTGQSPTEFRSEAK